MSMNIPPYPTTYNTKKTNSNATATMFGLAGMTAYYLPVTKNRFVRQAFRVTRNLTEDKIQKLEKSAYEISKKRLSPENKLFLSEEGVAETMDAITLKCQELRKTIFDSDTVKNLKKSFADSFKDIKNSEALRDTVASKAISRIRWRNFFWGVGIGWLLGKSISSGSNQ